MNENPVEQYLREQVLLNDKSQLVSYKRLSLKKISKALNLKRRHAYKHCLSSDNVRKVSPLEVGSCRNDINVFSYNPN